MSDLSVTNTFVALTTIAASQVNQNYSDIVNYINNRDDGTATWDNMNVTATVGNPVTIKSNQSTTEVAIDNTATDGDSILTLKLSGSTLYTMGVDDSDSDLLKFGTTALTTNVCMQLPSTGVQVQFAAGSASTPSVSFIGAATTGLFGNSTTVNVAIGGAAATTFTASSIQAPNGLVGTPCYSLVNDTTTGFYAVTAGSMGYSGSGTLRATLAAAAPYVTIGDNANTTDVCLRINGVSTTGAQTATMTNGPTAGNPTLWLQINIKGTNRYIPCWA